MCARAHEYSTPYFRVFINRGEEYIAASRGGCDLNAWGAVVTSAAPGSELDLDTQI